jgi:hypothetical protein
MGYGGLVIGFGSSGSAASQLRLGKGFPQFLLMGGGKSERERKRERGAKIIDGATIGTPQPPLSTQRTLHN